MTHLKERAVELPLGHEAMGRPCLYCGIELRAGEQVVECPRCHGFQHVACWQQKGGCAKQGCPQVAQEIAPVKPKGDGPPASDRRTVIGIVGLVLFLIAAMFLWPSAPDPAQGRQKIVWLEEISLDSQARVEEVVEDFNDTHDELFIELQALPYNGLEMKLVVMMGANVPPDLMTLPAERMQELSRQQALYNFGTETEPVWGIPHPLQPRYLVVYGRLEDTEPVLEALDYILPRLSELAVSTVPAD